MRSTHAYAVLEISRSAWDEIAAKLKAADYGHAFVDERTIDLHGIAVAPITPTPADSTAESVPDFKADSFGEFDEAFFENAFVHIERMGTRSFWIGIQAVRRPHVHVRTGIANGKWFFRIEEDVIEAPRDFAIERPACHRKHVADGGAA